MKRLIRQSEKRTGFTIVELLTVMSIIIILIGILVPSLNMVRRYATDVKQRAQFHSIEAALELFKNEFEGYPDSAYKQYELDEGGSSYPGAARLCEAMVGGDFLGFHPSSRFRCDGAGSLTDLKNLYVETAWPGAGEWENNLRSRKGPYLQLERANAYKLSDIYGGLVTGCLASKIVLCDEYARVKNISTGKKIGMPVLYYKANTSGVIHDSNTAYLPVDGDNKDQFYNYLDNHYLVGFGMPWNPPTAQGGTPAHPMFTEPKRFYESTKNEKITISDGRPYRADSYILISAGFDGQYGTPDDIFNFIKE